MNPLYQMYGPQMPQKPVPQQPMNPMMRIMQAMQNPASFVKNQFPDIPSEIENNPEQILSYLQKTRGISDQQVQQLYNMFGRR